MNDDLNMKSDHELMLLCSSGYDGAFDHIVLRYGKRMFSFINRSLFSASRSEELVQEVFLRMFKHRHSYTAKAEFSTWCYTIATNLIRDENRSRRRRPASSPSGKLDEMQAKIRSPDNDLCSAEIHSAVHRAIETLPEHLREILVLRDLEGISYDEIGRILQVEVGTVKSRISRARQAFKEAYSSMGEMDIGGASR